MGGISNEINEGNAEACVHVSREKSGGVGACGDGVRGDVGAELGERECGGNEEHTGAVCSAPLDHESLEEVHRVPDGFVVDHHRRRRHDDSDERSQGEGARCGFPVISATCYSKYIQRLGVNLRIAIN